MKFSAGCLRHWEIGDRCPISHLNANIPPQTRTFMASLALRRVRRADQIPPRLFDITNAANYLSMSDKGVRELIVNGELPYIQKIPGRSPYLLDRIELDKWIERNKRSA